MVYPFLLDALTGARIQIVGNAASAGGGALYAQCVHPTGATAAVYSSLTAGPVEEKAAAAWNISGNTAAYGAAAAAQVVPFAAELQEAVEVRRNPPPPPPFQPPSSPCMAQKRDQPRRICPREPCRRVGRGRRAPPPSPPTPTRAERVRPLSRRAWTGEGWGRGDLAQRRGRRGARRRRRSVAPSAGVLERRGWGVKETWLGC